MKTLVQIAVTVLVLGALSHAYRAPIQARLGGILANLEATYRPCQKPIAYTLGEFDSRFGISKQEFLLALTDAEAIWEKPLGIDLFSYSPNGALVVNLVYDYRQEATNKLIGLGLAVDESKAPYDILQSRHSQMKSALLLAKADFDSKVLEFNKRLDSFNREVAHWNDRGGAPQTEFARLETEKMNLGVEAEGIKLLQNKVNGYVEEVNALAVVLNSLANALNVDVGKYNSVGASRGEEFTAGDYQSNGIEQKIDIYEFSSRAKLTQVLAHELGHALGLEHIAGASSIMFKLNQGTSEKLSPQDLSALKSKCGIK